jgi:hypothetical protein
MTVNLNKKIIIIAGPNGAGKQLLPKTSYRKKPIHFALLMLIL